MFILVEWREVGAVWTQSLTCSGSAWTSLLTRSDTLTAWESSCAHWSSYRGRSVGLAQIAQIFIAQIFSDLIPLKCAHSSWNARDCGRANTDLLDFVSWSANNIPHTYKTLAWWWISRNMSENSPQLSANDLSCK